MPGRPSPATEASVRFYKWDNFIFRGFRIAFNPFRLCALLIPGWNAFVTLMRNESDGSWGCSDAQTVSKFFSDSCVLGWNNKDNGNELPANLHSLCKEGETRRTRIIKCAAARKWTVVIRCKMCKHVVDRLNSHDLLRTMCARERHKTRYNREGNE